MIMIYETWLESLLEQKEPIRFTLFNYAWVDKDWYYNNRILHDHLVYLVTNQSYKAIINGNIPLTGVPGSLLWIPPGVPHTFRLSQPGEPMKLYHFRFASDKKFTPSHPCFFCKSGWHYADTVERMLNEYRQNRLMSENRMKAHMYLLLSGIMRDSHSPLDSGKPGGLTQDQLDRLDRITLNDPLRRIGTDDLAKAAGLEAGYFARQFGKTFGTSPRSWIVRERIRLIIAEMGESRLSLTELSEKYGYPDIYTFSKQFKKVTGQSPREYRKRMI